MRRPQLEEVIRAASVLAIRKEFILSKLALCDEVQQRVQTFTDLHQQAVLLARLRIATEATDVRL